MVIARYAMDAVGGSIAERSPLSTFFFLLRATSLTMGRYLYVPADG